MLFCKSVFCSTFFSEQFFDKTPTLCLRAHMFRLPWVRVIHFIFYLQKELHYVNSVQIWSFCWSVCSRIQSKYGKIQPSKNPAFGHFWTRVEMSLKNYSLLRSFSYWNVISEPQSFQYPFKKSILTKILAIADVFQEVFRGF